MKEILCPKCKNPLTVKGTTISGNSKYTIYQCEVCNYQEMKCSGIINKNGL